MLNLLIATVITIAGSIILLKFIKPLEKEEPFSDLEKAGKELLDTVVQSIKIDKFVYWLNRKLER